jgi:tetratricopeptide (TPR) repeat protein
MIAVATACTAGLMMIGSRSAGLGMILLWGAYFFLRKGPVRWVAVLAIAAIIFIPNTLSYRVTEGYKADPHAFSRIQIWRAALEMGADHPLLGAGPNLFYDLAPLYAFPTVNLPVKFGRIARKPHSEYLRAWAEGGAAGVVFLAVLLSAMLRLMITGWSRGREGPVLACFVVLYQALFHDLTEVFGLAILMIWLAGQLAPDVYRQPSGRRRRPILIMSAAGLLVAILALWMNLDLLSRTLWLKGQAVMPEDLPAARTLYERALILNPVLPGAARELARVELIMAGQKPGPREWERAESRIVRARKLNLYDSVPLRLWAALYVDIAKVRKQNAGSALEVAAFKLREASELEPHNVLIMRSLSGVLWDLGRRSEAEKLIEKALDEEPNYLEAHRTRIEYLNITDPEAAQAATAELERARERVAGYRPYSSYEETIIR